MTELLRVMEQKFRAGYTFHDHEFPLPRLIARDVRHILKSQTKENTGIDVLLDLIKTHENSIDLHQGLAIAFGYLNNIYNMYLNLNRMKEIKNDKDTFNKIIDIIIKFDRNNNEMISNYFTEAFLSDTSDHKLCQSMVDFIYNKMPGKGLYALKFLDTCLANKLVSKKNREQLLFNAGNIAIEHKQYQKAIEYYKELVENYSEKHDYYQHFGACFVYNDQCVDKDHGKKWLYKALKMQPNNIQTKIHIANWYARTNRFQEAIDWIDQTPELSKINSIKILRLNQYCFIHGCTPETDKLYTQYALENNNDVNIIVDHATSHLIVNDITVAENIINDLIQKIPKSDPKRFNIDWQSLHILVNNGQYTDAFRLFGDLYFKRIQCVTLAYGKEPWPGNKTGILALFCQYGGIGDYIFSTRFLPWFCKQANNIWLFVDERFINFYKNSKVFEMCKNIDIFPMKYSEMAKQADEVGDMFISACKYCPKHYFSQEIKINVPKHMSNKMNDVFQKIGDRDIIVFNMYGKHNSTQMMEYRRRIPIQNYIPLLNDPAFNNIMWVTVQRDLSSTEKDMLGSDNILILDDIDSDYAFSDTMHIINRAKCVITNDTSLLHLSATMEAKVLLMLSTYPHWYWYSKSDNTVYYKNVKIIRQKKWNDWSYPMECVKNYLTDNL